MKRDAVFVTGGAGFIGRRLIVRLLANGHRVVALDRSGGLALSAGESAGRLTTVAGDVLTANAYLPALSACRAAIHLAAATGRAAAADHFRVNQQGTASLVEACRSAGVERLVAVSSIAVTFGELSGYAYAQSKAAAELAIKASGLTWTIVRPAIVLGPGAPVLRSLELVAGLPVVFMPGRGHARVQPIHVDDLASGLAELATAEPPRQGTVELGGPEIVTIEELVLRIREHRRGRRGAVCHVPLGLLTKPLRLAEAMGLDRWLPVTAGQLASFEWNGVASPSALQECLPRNLRAIADMIASPAEGPADDTLDRECRTFSRHLVALDPTPMVIAKYREAHQVLGVLSDTRPFDRWLVAFARRGPARARVADAYAAAFARSSPLRKKLVTLLAILETTAPSHEAIDGPLTGGRLAVVLRVALGVASSAAFLVLGALLIAPVRALMALRSSR